MSFKDSLNKHYAHTQNSVKKYEVGGKVVTKKGDTNDAKKGGYFDGRPHSQGGIKAVNIDNDQPIEVEGGEVVITKRAVADDSKKEFQGKMMTNKEILSKINESGGGVSFAKGGSIENKFEDGGELTDDDWDFELDHTIFADGGVILDELQTRVLKLIDNVTLSDGDGMTLEEAIDVFGDQLKEENTLQSLLADGFIYIYAGIYAITPLGKDYLAAQATQTDSTKVILPENQQRILEIIINSNKSELTYNEIRDKYFDKFSSNIGTAEVVGAVVDAMRELLDSNLITQVSPIRIKKAYKLSPLGFDKIDEIRQSNRDANNQTASINSAPLEIESIRVKINNIQEPNGSKNGIINKYRGPYQKIFENIAVYEDVEEYFQDFGKDVKGRDLNEFYVKIINPKFKNESESAIKEINKLNRVSVTEVIYKNSPSTEGVQVNLFPSNPIFEKYPFFAPDKVKETNPNLFALGRGYGPESQEKIKAARQEKEFYTSLLDDIPVTEVTERSEVARLINEQDEQIKFQVQKIQKEILPVYAKQKDGSNYIPTDIDDLIVKGRTLEYYIESNDFRDINYIYLIEDFSKFLSFCLVNPNAFYKIWLEGFFGDWINFSENANHDAKILSDSVFYPDNLSRAGRITNLAPNMNSLNRKPFYSPRLMWQGLSQIYNKVGFDAFPVSYYAANYAYAEWFANTKGQQRGTSGVILPCLLKILRPLELAEFGINKVAPNIFFDSIYLQTGMTPEQLEVNPAFLSDSTPPMEVWIYIRNNPQMLIKLKESGLVDGIHMFENNPSVSDADSAYQTEVWMTFFSDQTKVFPFTWWKDIGTGLYEDKALQTMSQFLSKGGKL